MTHTPDEIERLRQRAANITPPPRKWWSHNEVQLAAHGKPLALIIYWQGREWAATSYGVEKRDGTFKIETPRLARDWVKRLAGKTWVDLRDFAEALRVARRLSTGPGSRRPRRDDFDGTNANLAPD